MGGNASADFWVGFHWKQPVCIFPDEEREDCGFEGVLDWQCRRAGCCYRQPKSDNLPFCYHGKDTTITTTPSPTTTLFVVPTLPPLTWPTTITETTTTTMTGGSGFKENDGWLTVLDNLGVGRLGGWGFPIVPILIGSVAACLVGAAITGVVVGCGRCRHRQVNDGVYSEINMSPYQNTRLVNGPRSRND